MSKKLLLVTALVSLGAAGGLIWKGAQSPEPAASAGLSLVSPAVAQETAATEGPVVIDMTLGNPDAEVTVIEYASYTCPHCANFHERSYDQFKEEFVDSGKVKFIYREVYFDRYGLWAGLLARCAGPVKFFGMVDLIYERRDDWIQKTDADVATGLRQLGRVAGLEDEQVNACLADADKAKALVAEYQRNSQADGVNSTPSFIVNGENHRNPGLDGLRDLINAELGG